MKINQVVILAGGKGTRMKEMTEDLPKPMVKIGEIPVLEHLINIFSNFQSFEFLILTGYLSEKIETYFKDYKNVKIVNTGLETNTGGRIKKAEDFIHDQFLVTYGDGLANINIDKLLSFHESHDGLGTITVSNPISRFGLVKFNDKFLVNSFEEKPKLKEFVNIGFMVFEKKFLNYLSENSILESEPLNNLSKDNELYSFIHSGYFEPMDTYREYLKLNDYWNSGKVPWLDFE
ncbi:sugar phosphate nucleotidyltransferase [Acidimicrobiia bacterium]|nr:sugar phosphate nucleotidyltransferase [Acidimicrobiia bacterium]